MNVLDVLANIAEKKGDYNNLFTVEGQLEPRTLLLLARPGPSDLSESDNTCSYIKLYLQVKVLNCFYACSEERRLKDAGKKRLKFMGFPIERHVRTLSGDLMAFFKLFRTCSWSKLKSRSPRP